MKFLIPFILLLVGLGGGVGAGLALRPAPESVAQSTEKTGEDQADDWQEIPSEDHSAATDYPATGAGKGGADNLEYIKLNNQFVVPIVTKDSVDALIVMSLSLEMRPGNSEVVYAREPKLRDEFLRVLFNHANAGFFRGAFTDTVKLETLRRGLLEVAQTTLGYNVTAVLITDIARQDM